MKSPDIRTTEDGSHTLHSSKFGETYHSTFGAIQESEHIFIHAGLDLFQGKREGVHILEIGFGTGLNALLSLLWAEKEQIPVDYVGLEAYPVTLDEVQNLNYPEMLRCDRMLFEKLHNKEKQNFSKYFISEIKHLPFKDFIPESNRFDLVYFDAFSPDSQPEMWTEEGFLKLFNALKPACILTTYSCKGTVKRALKAAGFSIDKLPGPPGKREFLRATARK